MTDRPRINLQRLLGRLDALAQIGAIPDTPGNSRLALTDEDKAGRDLVTSWMREVGLDVRIDGIGNAVATLPGATDGPPVMIGSHIDTVRTGGRYDGCLGVLAGLEVLQTVKEAGVTPPRPLAVAFFTDEEGSRFPPDMLGSLVYVGGLPLDEALAIKGIDGAVVGEELQRIGYAGDAPIPGPAPHAFVELHIEQGPIMDVEGITIGAVTGVQGISWTEVTWGGQANHAGTTPMSMRHDAGYAAARLAVFVRDLVKEIGHPQVGTVGRIEHHPNLVNVVAERVVMTVDLRNTDEETLQHAEQRLADELARIAAEEGVTASTRQLARFEPVAFDDRVIDLVERTGKEHGHTTMRLPAGAGHDAQMLARVCPAGMVFVPSKDGISHNPFEHTDPEDIDAGANVLLDVVLTLAEEDELP